MRVLCGIQPTGKLHIGNYLAAIRPFLDFQQAPEASCSNIFLIADLHGLTKPHAARNRKELCTSMARSLLALGLNPAHSIMTQQSRVLEHASLAWILSCFTRFSRALNMTQFKENRDSFPNVGMFTYPILQAADILLYMPDRVVVGADQRQHFELTAEAFDRLNQATETQVLRRPRALISAIKVKSLKDASKKMSKSDPDGCLFLCDDPDTVRAKIRRAPTDSIKGITYDPAARPSLANVVELFAALRRTEPHVLASEYATKYHEQFKNDLSDAFIHEFEPHRKGILSIGENEAEEALESASKRAQDLAADSYAKVLCALNFRSA